MIAIPIAISFILTVVLLLWLMQGGLVQKAMDHPNHRSLHARPTPRIGGLAMMIGMLVGWSVSGGTIVWMMGAMVGFLVAISFLDDLYGLPVAWRFLAHFAAAGVFVALFLAGSMGMVGLIVIALAMIWMTNLYNFMDGSDGLAGGMALFGFGAYALAAWFAADAELAGMAVVVVASAIGFLIFNFHPAKVFMGDAGSIPLGFLAAALGLVGWQRGDWLIWYPLIVFSPFVIDATITLLRRLLRGDKIWQAHRSHYYQRLVQMGWGHRKTALFEYGLMALAGGSGLWIMQQSQVVQMTCLIMWLLIYACLAMKIDYTWHKHVQASS